MLKKIGILLSVAIALSPGAYAATTRKLPAAMKPVPHDVRSTQSTRTAPQTPQERYLLPPLQKILAAQPAGSKQSAVKAQSVGFSGVQPNWGGFVSPAFYQTRPESSCINDPGNCGVGAVLAADVDHDGKEDAIVVQFDGNLNVLLGNGNGFAAPVGYTNPNYANTQLLASYAVDLNNDGYVDVVVVDDLNNILLVYLNLKNGTFGSPTSIQVPFDFGQLNSLALADVNNDGNIDAVTLASNPNSYSSTDVTVQTYLGTGTGSFQPATAALTQTFNTAAFTQFNGNLFLTLGDINKDGNQDIAVVMEELTQPTVGAIVVTTALGKGDGTFGALNVNNPITASYTANGGPFLLLGSSGAQFVDLNGDGNLDLAADVAGTSNALMVALGDGSGKFSTPVQTQNAGGVGQIVYADVTGDKIPDMIQSAGVLKIWTGKGDGTFTIADNGASYVMDSGSSQSLALADFNGDGNLDIAQLGGTSKQLSLFLGNGKGSYNGAPALASTTDNPPDPFAISLEDVADVQGAGFTSALYVDNSGDLPQIVTGLSDGKGNFTYKIGLSSTADPVIDFVEPVQADFNHDGKQDMLVVNTDGTVSVALSQGDGTFGGQLKLALPAVNCIPGYAATGDLNGDGKTDVVIAYVGDAACGGTGSIGSGFFTALGNGDGTFQAPTFTTYGLELYSVTLADMNLDGNLDLLVDDLPFQVGGIFSVDLLPGVGDGTFGQGATVLNHYIVSQVIAGDYNGDGKPDLVLLSEGEQYAIANQDPSSFDDTAGVLLFPGRGDGTFGNLSQVGTKNFFLNGSLTDVNGDGQPDLVLATYNTFVPNTYYGLVTLLGEGGGAFSAPVNTLESFGSVSPFPGNFNSDNAPDFIVQTPDGAGLYIGQGGDSITLTNSGASVIFGQPETFTATIAASLPNRPTPTGTVSFYDGTTLLGSVPLNGGAATYTTSALAAGNHTITATYTGDSNFNPATASTGTTVGVTALAPAFTLASGSSTLSLSQGQSGVATLTLAANATFSGAVTLACSGAPANASCTINPASVTLAPGGSTTATLVVTTTAAKASLETPQGASQHGPGSGSPIALGLGAIGLIAGWKWRKRFPMIVSLLLLTISGLALTACGGDSSVKTVAKGSFTVTVTATPSGSSGSAQTTTVAVTVQ